MACSRGLAKEYHFLLISYINSDGNYIEYDMLQRGVLWRLGRLAHVRPQLVLVSHNNLIVALISK